MFPITINSQNISVVGTVKKSKTLLAPINDVKYPKSIEPKNPPSGSIEPIHEISSLVNGPVISGVSSEAKYGNAGDVHPTVHPNESDIKFAA